MGNLSLKELDKLGYGKSKVRSLAVTIVSKHYKHSSKQLIASMLQDVRHNPEQFEKHELLGKIAACFLDQKETRAFSTFELQETPAPLKVYGAKHIEGSAIRQMENAMRLPVAVQGALMPDAHTGFGLPIGGVLATKNAVIPYAIGVDIGCRMSLSILDEGDHFLKSHAFQMKTALREFTHFGMEGHLGFVQEHPVLDSPDFQATEFLKRLQHKAARQIGSSGGGNHFVEFGIIELNEDNALKLPAKRYMALLSHSGSRGLGASIAQHYTRIAMNTCKLPKEAQQLAWLDMKSEAGQEYWLSMSLAGAYAKACHERIHTNVLNAVGLKTIARVENHHNFAWKDTLEDGSEAIIHRKGATPAHCGELGIIPGSMTSPAYLVSGNGVADALFSTSHGAGRAMSRQRAKENTTSSALKKILSAAQVTLIGGSVEENPLAYKNIDEVIASQKELIRVQGRFSPKIVRMNKD
ncbi:MAG: RtcB family protein [Chitinophagaceae bacterium]|nr:RtcB family protein [Chitinophagaceae bacterium]